MSLNRQRRKSRAPAPIRWELRLYIAGQTSKSIAAFANLKRVCEKHMQGQYRIEVIDLLKNPQLARGDQILAVPTLVRAIPEPMKKIIGDLSNEERVLVGLDVRAIGGGRQMRERRHRPAHGDPPEASGSTFARMEAALEQEPHYLLRLYVTGTTPASSRAIERVRSVCETHLQNRYELQVIDIYQKPALARDEQIVATPTLVKVLPAPLRRWIGDLSKVERVLFGLDLRPRK